MTGSISEPLDRLEVLVTKSPHKNIIEMEIEKEKEAGAGDELVFQATSCASFPTLSSTKNTRMTRVADSANAGNPFSMLLYANNDIVSNSINRGGGWETSRVLAFNKYFTDYSKKT